MAPSDLEASLSERARRFGIVVYENRLIHDARPGITDDAIADIEQRCRGPLPDGLKGLWRSSFGGSVDYDLEVQFGDSIVEFSFTELFYPGSDGYRDLLGWIEHEVELAEEVAEQDRRKFDGRLSYLPFGGFEYADRLYVCVEPGPDYGSVHAWMQGLPPAWVLRLNEDSVSRVADDIPSLFRMLDLASDPFTEGDERFAMGEQIAAIIDGISVEEPNLADTLRTIVRDAVVDWRGALANGSISSKSRHRRIAMRDAIERDNRELLSQLEAAKCSLDEPLRATGNALDLALALGKVELAELLFWEGCQRAERGAQWGSRDTTGFRSPSVGSRLTPGRYCSEICSARRPSRKRRADCLSADADRVRHWWPNSIRTKLKRSGAPLRCCVTHA